MVLQPARRHPCRDRRGARAHSRGDRLFDHRRGRSARWPLCLFLDRGDHLAGRRAAGDDFGGNGGHRRAGAAADPRPRRRLSVRRHDPDGRDPADRRVPAIEPADAICLALGHHRLCQRLGDPDLHGAMARTDQCADHDLCAGRRRSRDHLSVPLSDQGNSVAADIDCRHYRARFLHRL